SRVEPRDEVAEGAERVALPCRVGVQSGAIARGVEQDMADPPLAAAVLEEMVVAVGELPGGEHLVAEIGVARPVQRRVEQPVRREIGVTVEAVMVEAGPEMPRL